MNFKEEKTLDGAPSIKKPSGKKPRKEKTEEPPSKSEEEPSSSSQMDKPKDAKPPNRSILQLKVTLSHIKPPIWRRIQVLNNITFEELRNNINEAVGWVSPRSHQFMVQNPKKPDQNLIVDASLDGLVYDCKKEKGRLLKEQNTKVARFLNRKGDSVVYEYDLAESWMHQVVVEKVLPPPPPKAWYPKIKGGKRACPPEDCGGVDGYMHLVEVYKNPEHEEYEELIKGWLEDMYPGYDPEKFERKDVFKRVWMWVEG